MTLDQLGESVAIQWGMANDYTTIERIKLHAISARATIIQRRYDQTKIFPQSIIMTLKCQDIIKVPVDECGCFGACGTVFRSENQIPLPIIVKDDSYFMFVGDIKGVRSFSAITPQEVQDIHLRRFSSEEAYYYYTNNYLYFNKPLKGFTTRFVPENPLDVLSLGECTIGCVKDGELILESSLEEGILGLLNNRRAQIINDGTQEITIDGNNQTRG